MLAFSSGDDLELVEGEGLGEERIRYLRVPLLQEHHHWQAVNDDKAGESSTESKDGADLRVDYSEGQRDDRD